MHIGALNQALTHGLKLKQVHRLIEFKKSNWMKKIAKNEFERNFYKLMNNSVFGKTLENTRNHKDMKLVTNKEKYSKYIMKPNFKDGHSFSTNLFAVEMGKTEIKINKKRSAL